MVTRRQSEVKLKESFFLEGGWVLAEYWYIINLYGNHRFYCCLAYSWFSKNFKMSCNSLYMFHPIFLTDWRLIVDNFNFETLLWFPTWGAGPHWRTHFLKLCHSGGKKRLICTFISLVLMRIESDFPEKIVPTTRGIYCVIILKHMLLHKCLGQLEWKWHWFKMFP